MTKQFHILSLKWSTGGDMIWWRTDNRGYTNDVREAGVYTEEQVTGDASYYDDGRSTMAIPTEAIQNLRTRLVVPNDHDNKTVLGIHKPNN